MRPVPQGAGLISSGGVRQRLQERILPILAEHRELAADADAFGRQPHGRLTLLVDDLPDKAGPLDLLEDSVELDVVVLCGRVVGGAYLPLTGTKLASTARPCFRRRPP
jgi:hypothetical protein